MALRKKRGRNEHFFGTFETHSQLLYLASNNTSRRLQYMSHHIFPNVKPEVVFLLMHNMKARTSWDPVYKSGVGMVMDTISNDVDVAYTRFMANNRILRMFGFNHEFCDYRRVFADAQLSGGCNESFSTSFWNSLPGEATPYDFASLIETSPWDAAEYVIAYAPSSMTEEYRKRVPATTSRVEMSQSLPPTGVIIRSWPPRQRGADNSSSTSEMSPPCTRVTFVSRTAIEFGPVEMKAVSSTKLHAMTMSNLVKFRKALTQRLMKMYRTGTIVTEL